MEWIRSNHSIQNVLAFANANLDHSGVLEKLGFTGEALGSHNTTDDSNQCLPNAQVPSTAPVVTQPMLSFPTKDAPTYGGTPVPPAPPVMDHSPLSFRTTEDSDRRTPTISPGVPSTIQPAPLSPVKNTIHDNNFLELVPAGIFEKDFHPQLFQGTLPKPDEALTDTCQLAYCLALLQASPSLDNPPEETTRAWLRNTSANEDEQERLKTMATDLLVEFMHDELKDEKATAEIACIAPVLEIDNFQSLLGIFIAKIKDSPLLHLHALEGLDRVIRCAAPGSLDSDDLIKILEHVNLCLQGTYKQSSDYIYRLTRTVSHILDVMVDGDIKDLDRDNLHTPLLLYSKKLQKSTDPYIVFQAAYAYQALLRVPNEEQPWQTVLRHTGTVVRGTARIFSAVKGYNVDVFIDTVYQGVEGAGQILGLLGDAYKNFSGLKKSGRELLEALDSSFNQECEWYPMLRGIDSLLQSGELTKVKAMVCCAPCRRELAFQWGVCQRLGSLAADPTWDADSQEGAVAFLGEIYRNDLVWGQEAKVKQCVLDILMRLASTSSASGNVKQAVDNLLQKFETDDDLRKRDLYIAIQKEGPSSNLYKVALLPPSLSPLLNRVQKIPAVEADLRKFGCIRLQDLDETIYIAPEAKAHRQAPDSDRFDLTTKVKEFLESEKKVLLIWGDSGAGKSTFNKELERELWNDYNNCKDRILKKQMKIPIFVSLSTVDKSEKDLIGRQLREADFSKTQISELKANRKFVLICDGYDECQQKRNFYDINKLNRPGQWKAHMIVSCRSEYLGHDYRSLFQPENRNNHTEENLLQEAVIAPFSEERIQAYIEQYITKEAPQWKSKEASQWEVRDYLRIFDQIPSLQELVTNPFLLTLSLGVLPNMLHLGPSVNITRIMLYDQFLDLWIEQGKRRLINRELVGEDKRAFDTLLDDNFSQNAILFVAQLAVAIFKNQDGSPAVEYSHIREKDTWKAAFFGQDEHKKLLREVCPLHRDGNIYRFIHQSVLEYGMARAVFEPRQRGNDRMRGQEAFAAERERCKHQGVEKDILVATASAPDDDSPLLWRNFVDKPGVLQFLAERVLQEPVFKRQLHDFIEYSKTDERWGISAANSITILIRAGVRFNGEDLKGIRIPEADLSGGQFDYAQLQGADLRNVNFRNVWLRQADLSNAKMSGVQFGEWPYLKEEDLVLSCSYSPDGKTFAVGLRNGTIIVYDTATWEKIYQLPGHTKDVCTLKYSPKGHQIVSGGRDKTVRLWNAQNDTPGLVLRGHASKVIAVAFSPSGSQIVSGSKDNTVRLWNAETGLPGLILRGYFKDGSSVTYSPDSHYIALGRYDGTVLLWNAHTGTHYAIPSDNTSPVSSVAYSPSGHQIASGRTNKTVCLWKVHTGEDTHILTGHTAAVTNVAYSPSGHQIASGSRDQMVRLWDAQTGAPGPILSGHTDIVHSVTYSPSGGQIASGSRDMTVRLWDAQTGAPDLILRGHTDVSAVAFSPGGHQIVSGKHDGTVQLWDAQTGTPDLNLIGHSGCITSAVYSPSGRQIASSSRDKTVRLWHAQTGAPGPILRYHRDPVSSVTYSPSGHQIASGSWDSTVRLWDAQTGAPLLILYGHTDGVNCVTYSPSGYQIASGSRDSTVRLWDAQTGASGLVLSGHTRGVCSVIYSPSGNQIASAGWGKTVHLWDAQTGDPGLILRGHTKAVTSVAYSPSGRHIASGSKDKTVRLWDARSGACLVVVEEGTVSSIAWKPSLDGISLTIGCDNSISVWSVIEEENQWQMRLNWRSTPDRLSVSNVLIQNVQGLNRVNLQLLRQRGAVGNPAQPPASIRQTGI